MLCGQRQVGVSGGCAGAGVVAARGDALGRRAPADERRGCAVAAEHADPERSSGCEHRRYPGLSSAKHPWLQREPASAFAIAGFCDEMEKGTIKKDSVVVCTLTGHGLKDPDIAIKQSKNPISVSKGGQGLREVILSSID